MLYLILFVAFATILFYYFFINHFKYWEKRGIPNPPVSYLFGNLGQSLTLKKSVGQVFDEMYKKYSSLGYVGFYKIRQPGILVRDPEIVKEILSISFNSFHSNDIHVDENIDPIISRNPFFITGEKWKRNRNQLTPCFTIKHIKSMVPLMVNVADNFIQYLHDINPICVDAKELSGRYTTDVVASCGFGVEANSFKDPDCKFKKMESLILNQSLISAIKHLILFVIPSLAAIFKTKFIPDKVAEYFQGIISETFQYRKDKNVVRGDFLDLMLEYKQKLGEDVFTDVDVLGHAISFIADGIETSSIVLSFALFELGANPEMQNKLRKEVDEALEKNGDDLNYEAIQEMTYLEKFFCESIRLHPAGMCMSKLCTSQFQLPSPDKRGPGITIDENTVVVIPVYSLQNDPNYFRHPENFDPERFSEENKELIPKFTYLPFGEGPRACLGQRFGIAQVKVAMVKLISKFEIRVNNKTKTPLEIDPTFHLLAAKGGLWLDFYKRK